MLLFALGCNSDAVAPPQVIVPGEEGDSIPTCEGQYCNETALGIYDMNRFYRKIIVQNQLPFVGSHRVEDRALEQAVEIVDSMISKDVLLWAFLIEAEAFIAVMSEDEVTTDIPEHSFLKGDDTQDWDTRARGLGATRLNPITTVGEENLLCLDGDVYAGESILVHEFAHSLHVLSINGIDPDFDAELDSLFWSARAEGLWENTYANTNRQEYWAEGVQSWFNANQRPQDGIHNHVNTRDELMEHDPGLHELISRWFPETSWTPTCPSG